MKTYRVQGWIQRTNTIDEKIEANTAGEARCKLLKAQGFPTDIDAYDLEAKELKE